MDLMNAKGDDLIIAGLKAVIGNHGDIKPTKTNALNSMPLTPGHLFRYVAPSTIIEAAESTLRAKNIVFPTDPSDVAFFVRTLTGKTTLIETGLDSTVENVKAIYQDQTGTPPDQQRLIFNSVQFQDGRTLKEYNVKNGNVVHLILRLQGGGCAAYYIDKEFFDPRFNYDFTKKDDTNKSFIRGGAQYTRPIGCKRYAIKVEGKYPSKKWLGHTGEAGEEWPVAYHGTMESNCASIVREGFDVEKCKRFAYGHGIYCTPDPLTAKKYAKEYVFQGKTYHLIFQVRVNPETKVVVRNGKNGNQTGEYWLVPDGDHMRPYGICVYPA